MASALMIQGTTSDAGKSTICAGLCRILARRGLRVAPFKPQNMSLNSAVTTDGGEIGRAQALQAFACGIELHSDMNPVLLKPMTDQAAQVIIQGKVHDAMQAQDYHNYKKVAMDAVQDSWQRLNRQYDVIIVEGAGSPAEINLREGDIANMGFALSVDCPVIIAADIDRGGVFAHLVGTHDLLSNHEQELVKGFIINKFRGAIELLLPGNKWLEDRLNKPVLGTIPWIQQLKLDAEDAIQQVNILDSEQEIIKVAVPVLPRISNHTDFDVLQYHPQVQLQFVPLDDAGSGYDWIILPGSKNTAADLQALLSNDWQQKLDRHLRYGGKLMGICGGYQMLGQWLHDPHNIESGNSIQGLGYLDMNTLLEQHKQLHEVEGTISLLNKTAPCSGYEIHMGVSEGSALKNTIISDTNSFCQGAQSSDGQIIGTYWHAIFDRAESLQLILQWAGLRIDNTTSANQSRQQLRHTECERLANTLEQSLDIDYIDQLLALA